MLLLVALSKIKKQSGFTLYELIVAGIIVAIASAIAVPNLLGSQREQEAKEAFTKIRGALVEAQTNANRQSTTCTVQFTPGTGVYNISGTPTGCILEPFQIDTDVVSVTKTNFSDSPTDIKFSFTGTTSDASTLWITRKDFSNNAIQSLGRCIVVSSSGMIRSGINDNGTCHNRENDRYDNS